MFSTMSRLSHSARSVHDDRLAVEQELAGVDEVRATDALDESGLARAVVTDERGDLTDAGVEIDVAKDVDAAETLVDTS
jgi:hypothetical protein